MATPLERVPFEVAISEPLLLKRAWLKLSAPQQTALRVFYGLPLDEEGLRHYSMFQGLAEFDDLGFVKKADPFPGYVPREHDEAVAIFGRRSAKTSNFLSWIMVYESLLGGHTRWASKKQHVANFFVAQKLDVAQAILRDFVEPLIASSPLLEKEIENSNIKGISLKNNSIIAPAPPSVKFFRYYAIPVVCIDEAAFFYKDAESANPDYEVIRAIEPAQAQFPNRKMAVGSTIYTKQGIVWEAKEAGNYGYKLADDDERKPKFKHTLVLVAPTPAMENPLLDKKWFERQKVKDPEAYDREILNKASDSVSGMFPEELLRRAIAEAPSRRPCEDEDEQTKQCSPRWYYVAAMDPAFRGDDFAFTIGHYERGRGFIQDLLKKWSPKESKLNPATILDEIKVDLDAYHADAIYSDQYQLESLQQLAMDRGFTIIGMDFTASSKAKMFGSYLQLLRNDRIHMLRNTEQFQEFLWIQKTMGQGGYIRVSAPVGKHDDLVMVTVLCAAMAIRYEVSEENPHAVKPEPTPYERVMESLAAKAQGQDEYL
jgi:hypothetical protein